MFIQGNFLRFFYLLSKDGFLLLIFFCETFVKHDDGGLIDRYLLCDGSYLLELLILYIGFFHLVFELLFDRFGLGFIHSSREIELYHL